AREGRLYIMDRMDEVIKEPVGTISNYAPKIITLTIPPEKIGAVIGSGGKTIRSIIERTGANVNVEDDGTVTVSSKNREDAQQAYDMVRELTQGPEVGKVYEGRVARVVDFGAFIEILPGQEGLCHISQLEHRHVNKVSDVLKVGDTVKVKVTGIDNLGRINLSRKEVLPKPDRSEPKKGFKSRPRSKSRPNR
ncbi:MAG: S1 RNA-binding domain-containing protein, partial [Spirochaetota bacterium]